MPGGTIIVLDGSTSAGKTTLARCLQRMLGEPYWHLPVDAFTPMLPVQPQAVPDDAFLSVYHRCIEVVASAGHNVIADTGMLEAAWLSECVRLLSPFRVLFVAVSCPLEELERRERQRGDRPVGYARSMAERVHRHGTHDLIVDTSVNSPEECASIMRSALGALTDGCAFERMRRSERPAGTVAA